MVELPDSSESWVGRARPDIHSTPDGPDSSDPLADDVARVFIDNMSFVKALGVMYGFESLFFWQPIVSYQDDYETTETQVKASFDRQYFDLYEHSRAALMDSDDRPIDLTKCLGPSPELGFFIDHVHLNEDGNAKVAGAIFPFFQSAIQGLRS